MLAGRNPCVGVTSELCETAYYSPVLQQEIMNAIFLGINRPCDEMELEIDLDGAYLFREFF